MSSAHAHPDPDALFATLSEQVPAWPRRPAAARY